MGYYCTVPQCTSLAGKTKNVKFHRFPRDRPMADRWNDILKRGKPYTKYSKVCSLHFTQADYNVTTMGQWKTLSKDAVPTQNLPKLNADGTVMVIRKSRTIKYKETRKDDVSDKEKWNLPVQPHGAVCVATSQDNNVSYRLQALSSIASTLSPHPAHPTPLTAKPKKQDAIMQTDPVNSEEDDSQPNNSYSEPADYTEQMYYKQKELAYAHAQVPDKPYQPQDNPKSFEPPEKKYEAKDYSKTDDYIPQTNEEYNKEAEKYALERKALNGYEKDVTSQSYSKMLESGYGKVPVEGYGYRGQYHEYQYPDSADVLRNQQQNLQVLQEQHRIMESQNGFENPIKQEIEISEEDKYPYDRKDPLECSSLGYGARPPDRLLDHLHHQVKQEPDVTGCDTVMQPQDSPYYSTNGHTNVPGGYTFEPLSRPGPELLIAKQNALAAHTQLWQNQMKRPFFYTESPHYTSAPLLHRYTTEDLTRILQ